MFFHDNDSWYQVKEAKEKGEGSENKNQNKWYKSEIASFKSSLDLMPLTNKITLQFCISRKERNVIYTIC